MSPNIGVAVAISKNNEKDEIEEPYNSHLCIDLSSEDMQLVVN